MKHENIDSRRDARRPTYITGKMKFGTIEVPCWVRDLSAGGALVFAEVPLNSGDRVIMEVDDKQLAAYVRWIDYPLVGVQFEPGSMVRGKRVTSNSTKALDRNVRNFIGGKPDTVGARLARWFKGD